MVVAVAGLLVGLLNGYWISSGRPLGGLNADEAGYIATSLRYQRFLLDAVGGSGSPSMFFDRVRESTSGPLAPLLSMMLLSAGSRSAGWAMAVQPVLHGATAVAAAGIANALGGARRAMVTGCVVLGLPGLILSARSYELAGGATAALCVAVWALLRSDRGQRTWVMVGFGVAVGCMVLFRAMAIVYLPGLGVAAAWMVGRSRRGWRNVAFAVLATLAVAGPWWLAAWPGITDYLFRYGYGDRAEEYGSTFMFNRVAAHVRNGIRDVRPLLLGIGLVAGSMVIRDRRSRRRADPASRSRPGVDPRYGCIVAIVLIGYAGLLTSSNSGVWFGLPLEVLAVALVVSVVPAEGVYRRLSARLGGLALLVAAVNVALVGHLWVDPQTVVLGTRPAVPIEWQWGGIYSSAADLFYEDDTLRSPHERSSRAADWWAANLAVAEVLADYQARTGGVLQSISGSSALINYNSILLAQELTDLPTAAAEVPDTTAADLSRWLEPWSDGFTRIIVVLRGRAEPFPPDVDARRLQAEAERRGWIVDEELSLPDGGDVVVLAHPDSAQGNG